MGELELFFNAVEPQVEAITGEEHDIAQFKRLVAVFNKVCVAPVLVCTQMTSTLCIHLFCFYFILFVCYKS